MRKLVVNTFVTLDGALQAPGAQAMVATLPRSFALLLGRRTYERLAAHAGELLDEVTTYVATSAPERLGSGNAEPLEGDVPAAVARLKATGGPDLHVHGSGHLVQTLDDHRLVDEYRLWVFPAVQPLAPLRS
jgi:dihydrofolate reductase